jgi:integrase
VGLTDLPYTYIAKRKYWRFRHKAVGDVALPGLPGDAAFHAKYSELVALAKREAKALDDKTFAWLVAEYRKSAEFRALRPSTQIDYDRTLKIVSAELGDQPFRLTTRAMVKAVRDDHSDTPRKAHKIQQMVSGLYAWADQASLVPTDFNPVSGLKKLRNPNAKEYTVWSVHEFGQFQAHAIEPMIVATMLARYTGQRAEDIVRMTWLQFQGDIVRVRQSKTGALLDVACHVDLRVFLEGYKRKLDREKRRGLMILTNAKNVPYNANSLSSAIGREVAKVPDFPADRSIHGLRYMAGSDMDEAGCTVAEIESVLGHHTFKMALKYASQRLRAKAAAAKREQESKA